MQFTTPHSPGRVLAECTDPMARIDAHLELGRRALETDEVERAAMHFREACDLDPTDERPRAELRGLGKLNQRTRWWLW